MKTAKKKLDKIEKKYEKKMVLTGMDVTLCGTKARFLNILDFWDMFDEISKALKID